MCTKWKILYTHSFTHSLSVSVSVYLNNIYYTSHRQTVSAHCKQAATCDHSILLFDAIEILQPVSERVLTNTMYTCRKRLVLVRAIFPIRSNSIRQCGLCTLKRRSFEDLFRFFLAIFFLQFSFY